MADQEGISRTEERSIDGELISVAFGLGGKLVHWELDPESSQALREDLDGLERRRNHRDASFYTDIIV